jgi:hypothetical protein
MHTIARYCISASSHRTDFILWIEQNGMSWPFYGYMIAAISLTMHYEYIIYIYEPANNLLWCQSNIRKERKIYVRHSTVMTR